jgi:hypothetical protein
VLLVPFSFSDGNLLILELVYILVGDNAADIIDVWDGKDYNFVKR